MVSKQVSLFLWGGAFPVGGDGAWAHGMGVLGRDWRCAARFFWEAMSHLEWRGGDGLNYSPSVDPVNEGVLSPLTSDLSQVISVY